MPKALSNGYYLSNPTQYDSGSVTTMPFMVCDVVAVLAAAGWSVVSWGDSGQYHNDGSVPTSVSYLSGFINIQAAHADNANGDKQSWCISFHGANLWAAKHSRADGFSGGGVGVIPSAADEVYLVGSDVGGVQWSYVHSGGQYLAPWCVADGDSNAFFCGAWANGTPHISSSWAWFTEVLSGYEDGDLYPYILGAHYNEVDFYSSINSAITRVFCYVYDSSIPGWKMDGPSGPQPYWFNGGQATDTSYIPGTNALYFTYPVMWGGYSASGWPRPKGWGKLMRWVGSEGSVAVSNLLDNGTDVDGQNGLIAIKSAICVPWDGTVMDLSAHLWAWTALGGGSYQFNRPSESIEYLMRGYDTTLGKQVYWSATTVDASGASYTGPGPLIYIRVYSRLASSS